MEDSVKRLTRVIGTCKQFAIFAMYTDMFAVMLTQVMTATRTLLIKTAVMTATRTLLIKTAVLFPFLLIWQGIHSRLDCRNRKES